MAILKPLRGHSSSLNARPLCDGSIYFCVDTGLLYVDCEDDKGNLVRLNVLADRANKVGYTIDDVDVEIKASEIATKEYVRGLLMDNGNFTKEIIFEMIYPCWFHLYIDIRCISVSFVWIWFLGEN